MKGPQKLLEYEDRWVTRMGIAIGAKRVLFRDKDLFNDLKDISWIALLLYGITGRFFNDRQVRLFEAFWTLCASYPEARLWNNRVAALAGTARSTAALAIGAANAASEASIYGGRPLIGSIDFLIRTQIKLDEGADLSELIKKELKQYRSIFGYGRPIKAKDERIDPLMALAKELGLADGPYVKLVFRVEEALSKGRWRLNMNIVALGSGLAADQGLTPLEYYRFMIQCFSGGMYPCYIEAYNKPEGAFFPLRCDRIQYQGPEKRNW